MIFFRKPVPTFRDHALAGGIIPRTKKRNFLPPGKLTIRHRFSEGMSMRRISAKPAGEPASQYRPLSVLPAPAHMRKFASACHDLAERENDSSRRALFREMECAWEAVAAQVERTNQLITKLRVTQCQSLN